MADEKVIVDIDLKGEKKVNRDLQKVKSGLVALTSTISTMAAAINPVTLALIAVLAAVLAPVVAFAALAVAMKKTATAAIDLAENLDPIGKKAAAIGISAENLQLFQGALGLAGVEANKTSKMFVKMRKNIGLASAEAGPMRDMIEDMGISMADLERADAGEQFLMISQGISQAKNEAVGMDIAMTVLGKAAGDAFGTIKQGRGTLEGLVDTMRGYGVASNRTVGDAEALNDAIAQLKATGFAFKTQVLGPLMPLIEGVALGFAGMAKEAMGSGRVVEDVIRIYAQFGSALAIEKIYEWAAALNKGLAVWGLIIDALTIAHHLQTRQWAKAGKGAFKFAKDLLNVKQHFAQIDREYGAMGKRMADSVTAAYQRSFERHRASIGTPAPAADRGIPLLDGGAGGTGGAAAPAAPVVGTAVGGFLSESEAALAQAEQAWISSIERRIAAQLVGVDKVSAKEAESLRSLESEFLAAWNAITAASPDEGIANDAALESLSSQYESMKTQIKSQATTERLAILATETAAEQATHDKKMQDLKDEAAERQRVTQLASSAAMGVLDNFESFAGSVTEAVVATYGEGSEEAKRAQMDMFFVTQAVALAQAVVNTALAITNALATPPVPLGIALAVAAGISGALQIGTIMATTVAGVGDAGITPAMLAATGGGRKTVMMRNDEMLVDPVGTRHITEMLAMQRQGMGGGDLPVTTQVTLKMDGRVLGQVRDTRRVRALERGYNYQDRVRGDYRRA